MILIISSKDDRTTNDVIDWLRFYKMPFLRISSEDVVDLTNVNISGLRNDIEFEVRCQKYKLSDFISVWYRRNWIKINFNVYENTNSTLSEEVNKQLLTEIGTLSGFLLNCIELKSLNRPQDMFINKLSVLRICKEFEINIPETIITTKKKSLINFFNKKEKIISKNYSQGVFVEYENSYLNSYTMLVSKSVISELPDSFHPMMFQEYIEKSYEVRSFYLNEKFFSSAIMSQNDEKTKIDFRNYNDQQPNRTPPYILPKIIENKLISLMNNLKLNSGSIDLIVNSKGEYYFLEVNPIGQFSQVSKPCNYFLENEVSKFLINKSNF